MKSLVPYPVDAEVLNLLVQQVHSGSAPDDVVQALRSAG